MWLTRAYASEDDPHHAAARDRGARGLCDASLVLASLSASRRSVLRAAGALDRVDRARCLRPLLSALFPDVGERLVPAGPGVFHRALSDGVAALGVGGSLALRGAGDDRRRPCVSDRPADVQ